MGLWSGRAKGPDIVFVIIGIKQTPNEPVIRVETEKSGLWIKFILVPLLEDHALFLVVDGIILDYGLGLSQ